MPTPTINWSNVNDAQGLLGAANTATNGYFWTAILYTFIVILTLSMIQFGVEVALMVALFIGMVAGIILLYLDLITTLWLGIIIGSLLFLIIYFLVTSQKNQGY